MEKTLVIAEKPDMGRHIAAVIEPRAKNNKTYLEGERYIITWAIGHLVGLAEPEHYNKKFKQWNFSDLPIIPSSFKLFPLYRTKAQLNGIGELAKRCRSIINACDAGREGQLIFEYLRKYLQLRLPVQRLWISDLTEETIRQGFQTLKDESHYQYLTSAAVARSQADWLIGMNGTRAFSAKHRTLLSVGRVQTPVLALIYDRETEIQSFVPSKYHQVYADFNQGTDTYRGIWQGPKIVDRQVAETIVKEVEGKDGCIDSYEKKESKEWPHKLYDLTLLQREANAKFGFSAKKTLDLAQSLYEKHKVISYPRTNSNYVNEQTILQMQKAFEGLRGSIYDPYLAKANKALVNKNNKNICNPGKVEDHHAIIPTGKKTDKFTEDEKKIFDLIVRRFLSQFYPPARYFIHTVLTSIHDHSFKTVGKELIELGWKWVYDASSTNPKVKSGDEDDVQQDWRSSLHLEEKSTVLCVATTIKDLETKPPRSFTEGTLLKEMESAGKQVEEEEVREAMKDSGLGTPATRAGVIERLKKVGYIGMKGRSITITSKGKTAIELIRKAEVDLLTSPEMTGRWEKRLSEIAKGQADTEGFMESVKKFTLKIVHQVAGQSTERKLFANPPETATSNLPMCPREGCSGKLVKGKKGIGCSEYRKGCRFFLWNTFRGKTLSEAMVKSLLEKGRTNKLKFKDKQGQVFNGRITLLDRNTGQLELERVEEPKEK
jgi:DNA topoisomerase-3